VRNLDHSPPKSIVISGKLAIAGPTRHLHIQTRRILASAPYGDYAASWSGK